MKRVCTCSHGNWHTVAHLFQLLNRWIERCSELKIPVSEDFSVIDILSTNYEIREWNTYGLPRDNVSTENAVLVTRGRRWPLMIDPQEQVSSFQTRSAMLSQNKANIPHPWWESSTWYCLEYWHQYSINSIIDIRDISTQDWNIIIARTMLCHYWKILWDCSKSLVWLEKLNQTPESKRKVSKRR